MERCIAQMLSCLRACSRTLSKSLLSFFCHNNSRVLMRLRPILYKNLLQSIGDDCRIKSGVIIEYPEFISIGDRVSIQHNCFISGYGGITIGNDISVGNDTKIISSDHIAIGGTVFRTNPLEKKSVILGNNIVVGTSVVILGGNTIGSNVMIGAGSIVTKSVPDNCIFAGNPAKKIRDVHFE